MVGYSIVYRGADIRQKWTTGQWTTVDNTVLIKTITPMVQWLCLFVIRKGDIQKICRGGGCVCVCAERLFSRFVFVRGWEIPSFVVNTVFLSAFEA
jgi:hypothetical protein